MKFKLVEGERTFKQSLMLKEYEKSVTSQWGEDGVIEEIFNRIGTTYQVAVDIGAWDGFHFSNTWALAKKGWIRILSEADPERLKTLDQSHFARDKVYGKCNSIDETLQWADCPEYFDLLSIDVDGDDYYLWKDMHRYRARVVVIEFNQTIPEWMDIKQERGGSFGASYAALWKLADDKDYHLIHVTTTNMIFVCKERIQIVSKDRRGNPPLQIEKIIEPHSTQWLQHIITGYNGKQYLIGKPAHNDDQGGKHEKLISDIEIKPI